MATPVIREVYVAETTAQAEDEARNGIMYIDGGMYGKWANVRPLRDEQGRLVENPATVTLRCGYLPRESCHIFTNKEGELCAEPGSISTVTWANHSGTSSSVSQKR